MRRCSWVNLNNKDYINYHDNEWGIPEYCCQKLFEILSLEGAQAGLSWETILNKRQAYRRAFANFAIDEVSNYSDTRLLNLLTNTNIVKNKAKIFSVRSNAQVVQKIQDKYGSFSEYIWSYVDHKPIINSWSTAKEVPTKTALSLKLATNLRNLGMKFVGPVIMYSCKLQV